jgi:hypothetical protein
MTIEIKVPQLPESVTDATLVSWHKKPGDIVSRDENLVDLETDKVVLEVPAPASGILRGTCWPFSKKEKQQLHPSRRLLQRHLLRRLPSRRPGQN